MSKWIELPLAEVPHQQVKLIHPTPAGEMADANLFVLKSAKAPRVHDGELKGKTFEILYDKMVQMSMAFGNGVGEPKAGAFLGESSDINDIIHLRAREEDTKMPSSLY